MMWVPSQFLLTGALLLAVEAGVEIRNPNRLVGLAYMVASAALAVFALWLRP